VRLSCCVAGLIAPVLLALAAAVGSPPALAASTGPGGAPANIVPQPAFPLVCPGPAGSPAHAGCSALALAALQHARRVEHLPPMRLDLAAFERLPAPRQLFVLANLERVDRRLPPLRALTAGLDRIAATAARGLVDPLGPVGAGVLAGGRPSLGFLSNLAVGLDPLGSDYFWMYDDGPGGSNRDCTASRPAGCWVHRLNILFDPSRRQGGGPSLAALCSSLYHETPTLVMGAGQHESGSGAALSEETTELFVVSCGPLPADVVWTWAQARRAVAG